MNKHVYIQNITLIVIGVVLIGLTIGLRYYEHRFDLLTQINRQPEYLFNTRIDNISKVKTNIKEDNIFEPINLKANSNILNLDAYFNKGNYYEFDIEEKNTGVKTSALSSIYLIGTEDKTIKYELTYQDGKKVQAGDTLAPKSTKVIHVRIERSGEDLKEKQYNLSLVLTYQEK